MAQFPPPAPGPLPPLIDWPNMVKQFSQIGVQWFREEFSAAIRRGRDDTTVIEAPSVRVLSTSTEPLPPPAERERRVGCPSCDAHTATIAAWGRVQSIMLAAEASGGEIPAALPSTLYLARADLDDARTSLHVVEQRIPSMRERVWACLTAIDNAERALPDPSACTVDACATAMPALTRAVTDVTMMSTEYEGKIRLAQGNERLRSIYEQAKRDDLPADEFFQRFRDELSGP